MSRQLTTILSVVVEYGAITEITRIEFRLPGDEADDEEEGGEETLPDEESGGGEEEGEEEVTFTTGTLWYMLIDPNGGEEIVLMEQPLLDNVRSAVFTLHYDVGPRLIRATIDLVIEPNDSVDLTIGADSTPRTIRLIASAAPRQSLSGGR